MLLLAILLFLGQATGSLKVVSEDSDGPALSASLAKLKKNRSAEGHFKSNPKTSSWPRLNSPEDSLKQVKTARNLQAKRRRRKARRPSVGRRPRMEPITPGGRFVTDAVLLDIHRRSLMNAFADPRSGNVRQRPGTECDLYAEFEPMFYTTITRTSSSVMTFSSNCMQPVTLNVENVMGRNRNINWAYHPRKVYLVILGNLYIVNYTRPRVIDRKDIIRSLRYSRANIQRTFAAPRNIRLGRRNSVYLAPQARNSLTTANLRRFQRLRGYWRCTTRPRRFSQYTRRIRRRRAMISKLRKQGFSMREISRMIRHSQFGPRASSTKNIETPMQVAGLAPLRARKRQRRRKSTRPRPKKKTKRSRKVKPRRLEVKQIDGTDQDGSLSDNTESVSRKTQQTVVGRTTNAVRSHTKSRQANPVNKRARRRRKGKRRPQRRRQVSMYEREEERQRKEDRRFIRTRLRRNFIWELVTLCTLR